MENTKRIHLLSSTEIAELYARPEFNVHEQRLYFTLNQVEKTALAKFSNTKTRLYFILQLGYFKAKQQFFTFSLDEVIPLPTTLPDAALGLKSEDEIGDAL